MKNFYAELSAHALRCWARGIRPEDEAGALNCEAVIRAVKDLPQSEQKMLMHIYASRKPFSQAVWDYARNNGIPEGRLWDKIRYVERRVAKERGLL